MVDVLNDVHGDIVLATISNPEVFVPLVAAATPPRRILTIHAPSSHRLAKLFKEALEFSGI